MRTQAIMIEDQLAWGDTGPLVGRLNINAPISAIDVVIEATNGSTSNQGQELHDDVDRIEIISGTDRLHSLSLFQGIIQHAYEVGRYPNHILTEGAAGVQQQGYRIMFGRFLGDPDYWLDPQMFSNLQYRLVGDLTISATVGFATGTRLVTLIAHTMPEGPAGRAGMFSSKEINQFTTLATGETRIDLPDDFPLRMLGIRAEESGEFFHTNVDRLKLTQSKDRFIHFDIRGENFRDFLEEWRGQHEINTTLFRADGDTVGLFFPYLRGISTHSLLDLNISGIDALAEDVVTLQVLSLTAVPGIAKESDDTSLLTNVRGVMPHFGGLWPFGDPQDPNQWLSGDGLSNLELVVTNGNAGAAASVWVQQVRP